jgi:hypothetical protein
MCTFEMGSGGKILVPNLMETRYSRNIKVWPQKREAGLFILLMEGINELSI